MTVQNREEAWREADRLFPTDYIKDDRASERAGYPIFRSTADGNESWISDLGNRLEVNTEDGKTVNIWIEEPKKQRHTSSHMRHFYSDEWCKDEKARTQEQLQEIARRIRESCDVSEITYFGEGSSFGSYTCTIYKNENLGLRYWVKDDFGHISEIDEERVH